MPGGEFRLGTVEEHCGAKNHPLKPYFVLFGWNAALRLANHPLNAKIVPNVRSSKGLAVGCRLPGAGWTIRNGQGWRERTRPLGAGWACELIAKANACRERAIAPLLRNCGESLQSREGVLSYPSCLSSEGNLHLVRRHEQLMGS